MTMSSCKEQKSIHEEPKIHTIEFFKSSCMDPQRSPDSRCKQEQETIKISENLRNDPTIPADPQNPDEPWALALADDSAVQLPAKHCAFRQCVWEGRFQSDLVQHLLDQHKECLQTSASLFPACFSEEERLYAAYNSALSSKVQKSAPLASHAIDRRRIYEYSIHLGDDKLDSLICFSCARRFPHVSTLLRNEVHWRTLTQNQSSFFGMGATMLEKLLGFNTYLLEYGRCHGAGMPNLREHLDDFEDWLMTVRLDGQEVKILCCPEDLCCENDACVNVANVAKNVAFPYAKIARMH